MPYLPSLPSDAAVMDVLKAYPESSAPLIDCQQVVLRGPSPLTVGERELIAAYVSGLNACHYCHGVHGAVAERFGIEEGVLAAAHYETDVVERVRPRLAEPFVAELTDGLHEGGGRAGMIKVAGSFHGLDAHATYAMTAAAEAHHATGAPIGVHLEAGTAALGSSICCATTRAYRRDA